MLTTLGLGLALLAAGPTLQQPPTSCVVEDTVGRCIVSAVDPGRPRRAEPERPAEGPVDQPRRREAREGGTNDPPAASAVRPPNNGNGNGLLNSAQQFAAAPVGPGGAAAALDPALLAQRAVDELDIAPPALRASVEGTAFVGVPLWLWIDGGEAATGPVSATATAGAARVTATARLSAVEWSMGPPGETVRCAGPGTPWTGQDGESPDCGFVYTQRSLPERTGGRGSWTVTATAVWGVTWSGVSGGAPVAGSDTVLLSSEVELPVGELQVLVGGGGR